MLLSSGWGPHGNSGVGLATPWNHADFNHSTTFETASQEDGTFIPQEGLYWDFKQEWPFSYSNDYFGAIARLVCAFANTQGGLIIFGVHDEARTGGHNKVKVNLDKFIQALRQLLSAPIDFRFKSYASKEKGDIDVLLVCARPHGSLPIRFKRELNKLKANVIWVRQGHEVIPAEPRHIPLLYCRSNRSETEDQFDGDDLGGSLPPSPATIDRFVGWIATVDKIFSWLFSSDEPRNFLYGRGGSGKTTIAYEVARTLRFEGGKIHIYGGDSLDNIIFVSAKEKSLDPVSQRQLWFSGVDFSNERELYEAILLLGGWTDSDSISSCSIDRLREDLKEFFEITSNFVVVDDIDTLTTKGQDAGFDYIYRTIARSKRQSKVLYTLRNVPTHSLANAIEVPGLEPNGEYEEFVNVCSKQFNVMPPTGEFRDGPLAKVSERRPLVVESIIALSRHSGSYERALALFEQGAGDDVRQYVFQREWDALPPDNYGRFLLVILALLEQPLIFSDIVTILTVEESRVKDAIAAVREMFLRVNDSGTEATYTVGALTASFIISQATKLDRFPQLKARVDAFKKTFYPEVPELTRLKFSVEHSVERGRIFGQNNLLHEAWRRVENSSLAPTITEDPRFKSLVGFVAASTIPPKLAEARSAFEYALAMRFEPEIKHLKAWFEAEKASGIGYDRCCKIADFINGGRNYTEIEKTDFQVKKASVVYNHAREKSFLDVLSAADDFAEALKIHLGAYRRSVNSSNPRLGKSEEYSRNTAYSLFNLLNRHGRIDLLIVRIEKLFGDKDIFIDPIEDPLLSALISISNVKANPSDLARFRSRLVNARLAVENSAAWMDTNVKKRVLSGVEFGGKAALRAYWSKRAIKILALPISSLFNFQCGLECQNLSLQS